LSTLNGGDSSNSQLEALLQVSLRKNEIGWSDNARKIVFLVTKTRFHEPVGEFPSNNEDIILDGAPPGTGEDYPSVEQVRRALLESNIIPIFVAARPVISSYEDLVGNLFCNFYSFRKIGGICTWFRSGSAFFRLYFP
jgi:hypothetical protein